MKIFIAYPYALEGYREALASKLASSDIELVYADEHLASDHVLRKIERLLHESDLSVFDVTNANPNVTLELGIAIAANHPYIVALDKASVGKLNADIHGWDQLRYDSVEELGSTLAQYIRRGRVPRREAMLAPAVSVTSESPLGQKPFPPVTLQPQAINPDSIFGAHVRPNIYNPNKYVLDKSDDDRLLAIERESRGEQGELHQQLALKSGIDGVVLDHATPVERRPDGMLEQPFERISIDSDGEITVRYRQTDEEPLWQYLRVLGTVYIAAHQAFKHFRVPGSAWTKVVLRLDARRNNTRPVLPAFFEDGPFVIDYTKELFVDAFTNTTLRLFRASGVSETKETVRQTLEHFARRHLPEWALEAP